MSKTLYISDLDGTLLNKESRISENSLKILNEQMKRGMYFTYATARSLVSSRIVSKGLCNNLPVIVYNGAYIMDYNTGSILYERNLTPQSVDVMKEVLNAHSICPLIYRFINDKEQLAWNPEFENDGIQDYLKKRKNDPRLHPVYNDQQLYEGKIFYMTCIGEYEVLAPIYERLKQYKEIRATFQKELYRPEYWLEIMDKKATKAHAIQQLKKMTDCDRVVCFGDAINDIPMFEIADEAYAVANAVSELKAIAKAVIDDHCDDGVAKWLKNQDTD